MSAVGTALESPYKGLAPFEDSELDALLFFGRERETEVIVANLLAAKLTVLYGPSGVGKSSILRAAVARRLREVAPGADVVVLDEWSTGAELPDPDDEAFLILDQFEEYFLYHDEARLHDVLPALLARPRVHVLLSLREDALARLDAFQARIPNVFANRLRLGHLDAAAARAAILGPLDRWNEVAPWALMGIESALVDDVIREVQSQPGEIEAPYLQLVLERIWELERDAGSALLRAETLHSVGGADAIVSAHLERALSALPPHDAEIATSALRFLVTPSRTKIAYSFADLVGYTNESPVELQHVLEILASQRILRSVTDGDDDGSRYEIFHDVLAEPVLAWRREFDARRTLAASTRRHRRLAVVAVGALLLALGMVALTVYAFGQRSEAAKQKRAALGQKAFAEQKTREALSEKGKADRATRRAQATARRLHTTNARLHTTNGRLHTSNARLNASNAHLKVAEHAASVNAAESRNEKVRADHQKLLAQRQTRRANASALVEKVGELVATAEADLGLDPVKSVRAAVEAAGLKTSNAVEDALRNSLLALQARGILAGGGGALQSSAFSPDGAAVATGTSGGFVRLFQTRTHRLVWSEQVGSAVAKLAFSPDGRELAVATAGKKALVIDVTRGKIRETLLHGGPVLDLVYAGGGKYIVTGSDDQTTRIWDASTGTLLHTERGAGSQQTIAVSPDGSRIAVVSKGVAVAHVFDVASGNEIAAVQQAGEVTDLAFSPNGAYLVTTGRLNGYVWDTQTWKQLHLLTGHEAVIDAVAFAPDGRVVTGSIDSSARIWDPATGASLFTLTGQQEQKLLAVAVRPDSLQFATASADDTVRLWNSPLGSIPTVLGGHTDSVTGLAYSPDGSLILTQSADGTARLWNARQPALQTLGSHQGAVSVVAYDPSGGLVLSAGADGTAKLWHASGGLAQTLAQGGKVTDASFTKAGVVTAGEDGTAKLWRETDGALLATYPHGSPVRAAAATAGGVITAGDDGIVRSWTQNGRLRWASTHGSPITAAAVSADGTVATGATDGTVRLWRGGDGTALRPLHGFSDAVTSLAFDANGTLLVGGSADHTARIWSASTGRLVHALIGHTLKVTSVSFSPSGKLVLTSSVDGDARIWSVETGRTVQPLKFHVSTVSQAAFSPDGRWVVTAGPSTAAIWQVRTGRRLYFLRGAHGTLTAAGWSPDSMRIVAGDTGGGVETFTCELCAHQPALVAQAKARLAALG